MLDINQYKKLKELKILYPIEAAKLKQDPSICNDKEILQTLMVLNTDRSITNAISEASGIFDDKETFKLIISILAKSYGQLALLYVNKYNDSAELEFLFNKLFDRYRKGE